ncbi:GNAT family N-acetyltransferase [Corallococcus sp. AS-1-12]|uniref:GNAT family N-acetyltransferase n=1 Tax=Corallococcus sp. AS-1-12 TaxID=2874598 RepID=UPI001CBC444D|nr:GNAT family N-acetyltransferase [Corallococcus sp. AS-1-12]MBZ4332134.1 GNAT family N-acetyltransferase [Corallococcus sp. AS-1-12]
MTVSLMFPELTAITSKDAASGFRCEEEALTRFFQQQATQQGRREENRTWVLHRPDGRPELPWVLGFYTLTWIQLERSNLPAPVIRRLPDYPVRAILIGRLARDERCKGMGIGEHLLDDAHRRTLRVNTDIGGLVVVVDAKNAHAAAFYEAHDYTALIRTEPEAASWPRRYFVRMEDLRATYEGT